MSVALVGAAKYTASTSTPVSPAFNQAPTAGNLLVMGVFVAGASARTCTTPTGWTAGPTGVAITGSNYVNIFLFWKVATGSDATPSLTVSAVSTTGVLVEEWSGLTATPHDVDSTVGTNNQNSTAAGTCNSGPLTTTHASDFIWSFLGARVSGSARTLTWGGGSSVDALVNDISADVTELGTATQIVSSTGIYTPTLAFAAGTGTWMGSTTASMAFKLPSTATGFIGWGVPA